MLEVKNKSCFNWFAERLALSSCASEGRRTKDDEGCYDVVVSNWPNIPALYCAYNHVDCTLPMCAGLASA